MNIQQLNIQAKLAFSLFLLFIITATISSVILLGLELTGSKTGINFPTISQIQNKYTTPAIISAMRGSMNEYVTKEKDIDMAEKWIKDGAKNDDPIYEKVEKFINNDCTNCHSKTSEMTKAMPGIPFESYEQILLYTEAGYSWSKMSKQAHIHMFGIGMFLIIVTLLFAYSTYSSCIRSGLIILSFSAAFLDIFSWWFSKYFAGLIYIIFGMGSLLVASILLMCALIIFDLWIKKRVLV